MLSNPLLTIFSPTKAPAMITPTYTDVFDFIFFEERERKKRKLINTDDDDEVENEGKSGKKNIILLKEKTQKRVRALSLPFFSRNKTHHERLVKRVEHLSTNLSLITSRVYFKKMRKSERYERFLSRVSKEKETFLFRVLVGAESLRQFSEQTDEKRKRIRVVKLKLSA